MELNDNDLISDLKLLIDISCLGAANLYRFEKFHNMLIRVAYNATDIWIDHDRKRVLMFVESGDSHGDYLTKFDESVPETISVNLAYKDFSDFLKACVSEEASNMMAYRAFLNAYSIKGKAQVNAIVHSVKA